MHLEIYYYLPILAQFANTRSSQLIFLFLFLFKINLIFKCNHIVLHINRRSNVQAKKAHRREDLKIG